MASLVLQAFPFVHPAIAGLALATGLIPILVHLINRRRYVRVPWAVMSLLLAATRRSARRLRIEQLLLMAARIALIVLFGLAVARPYLPSSSLLQLQTSRGHRILLIDNSLSMRARLGDGNTRFDLAKRCALRLLESFPPTDAVSIVTLSQPAEALIAQPAYDRRFVREQLAGLTATQRAGDTVAALSVAARLFSESDFAPGNRAVYIISDFPEKVWSGQTRELPSEAVTALRQFVAQAGETLGDLRLIRIASTEADNLAVTDLSVRAMFVGVDVPIRVVAEVTNFGSSTARDTVLQLRRGGEIIRQEPLPRLEPGATSLVEITLVFPTPGTHLIEGRLSAPKPDALSDDDVRYLSIEVREAAPVLLVDGRPGAAALERETGFLEKALAPRVLPGDATLTDPKIISAPELLTEALLDYDVIALCNVERLPAASWKTLEQFVVRGGGLLIFLGDLVSTDNYNRFGYANGGGLLPGRVGPLRPHRIADGNADFGVGIRSDDLVHPIVSDFADHTDSGLFGARIGRYLRIQPDAGRSDSVLRYTNDDHALVASAFGKGRVLVFTTSANMAWTNLPAKGDYVSLMLSAAAFLAPRHGHHRNLQVGEKLRERLSSRETSMPLRVTGSDAVVSAPALVPDDDTLALTHGPVERAGALTVSIGPRILTFTANVDPAEGDLAPIDEAQLKEIVGSSARVTSLPEATAAKGDVWSAVVGEPVGVRSAELALGLLAAVVVLSLFEAWMAMWFGSRRMGAAGDP